MSNQGSSSDTVNYKDGKSLTLKHQQPSDGEQARGCLPQRTIATIIGQYEPQISAEQAQFAKTAQAAAVTGYDETLPANPDHLDYILSSMKREGFMHSSSQSTAPNDTTTSKKKLVSSSQLEQVIGSWYYDLEQGGFAIDSTMAAILGIVNFSGFLDADFIFQFFDQVKREHIKHSLFSPELGDLLFRNVIITKGTNFGKRFTFQGQILSRNSQGKATKAVGSFAFESSPYAEFLTREIANDALFIWDRQLQSIISNTAFHQLLEQSEDKCPRTLQELMALIHPDDNDILSLQGHILSYPQYGDSYECCVRFKRSNQKYIWVTVRTLVTERNAEGKATRLFGAITNIDLLQENFDNLKLLMFTDPLTGLHNRTYFHQNQLRYEDPKLSPVSVIFLDVSALKLTNDILGHNYGDFLLLKASQLLQNALQVTLSELNADAKLVNSLISKRTALSNQTQRLGATLSNQNTDLNEFEHGDLHQHLLSIDERQQQVNGNMGLDHSSRGGKLERQVMGDAHTGAMSDKDQPEISTEFTGNSYNGNATSNSSGTSQAATLDSQDNPMGINPFDFAKITPDKVSLMQSKGSKALDCLDSPEGCLLQDSDINSKDRAILELPSDFFNELSSLGVTTVSMNKPPKKDTTSEALASAAPTATTVASPAGDANESNPTNPKATENTASSSGQAAAVNTASDTDSNASSDKSDTMTAAEAAANAAAVTITTSSCQPVRATQDNSDEDSKPTLDTFKQELNKELQHKSELKYPPEILRMGGDEFIVLCPNCDESKIKLLYHNIFKIRDMLIKNQEACPIEQRSVPICFGIGYATVGETDTRKDDFLQALQRADYRMQANKEKYHDQHYELLQKFFEEKLHRRVSMRDERRMQILSQKERTKLRQHLES